MQRHRSSVIFGYCCSHCCNVPCSRKHQDHIHTRARTHACTRTHEYNEKENNSRVCVKLYFYDKVQAAKLLVKDTSCTIITQKNQVSIYWEKWENRIYPVEVAAAFCFISVLICIRKLNKCLCSI